MDPSTVDLAYALAGVAFAAGWAVPTVARMVTTRSRAGVSALSLVFSVLTDGGWLAVAAHQRSPALAISSVAYLSGGVAALVVHRRLGGRTPWDAAILGGALLASAFVVGGPEVGATALLTAVLARLVPQVADAITSPDTTGISVVAWGMTAIEGLAWFAYGAARGAWPLVAWGAFAATGAAAILVAVAAKRRPTRVDDGPVVEPAQRERASAA